MAINGTTKRDCPGCGRYLRIEAFTYSNGVVTETCTMCNRHQARLKRTSKTRARFRTAVEEILAGVKSDGRRANPKPLTTDRLLRGMVKRFGGLEGFCTRWMQDIDEARAATPGGARVLRAMEGLGKLIALNTEQVALLPEVGQLTDAQLEKELIKTVLQKAASKPALMAELAIAAGLDVSFPNALPQPPFEEDPPPPPYQAAEEVA